MNAPLNFDYLNSLELLRDMRPILCLDGDEQLGRLVEKLQRKLRTTKAASQYELRGKLLRYALGLGYDYDLATTAVERVVE